MIIGDGESMEINLCPEGVYRALLPDEEFWAYIYGMDEPDLDENYIDDSTPIISEPCSVCKSTGVCGYDSEGHPMIHTVEDDNELSD